MGSSAAYGANKGGRQTQMVVTGVTMKGTQVYVSGMDSRGSQMVEIPLDMTSQPVYIPKKGDTVLINYSTTGMTATGQQVSAEQLESLGAQEGDSILAAPGHLILSGDDIQVNGRLIQASASSAGGRNLVADSSFKDAAKWTVSNTSPNEAKFTNEGILDLEGAVKFVMDGIGSAVTVTHSVANIQPASPGEYTLSICIDGDFNVDGIH